MKTKIVLLVIMSFLLSGRAGYPQPVDNYNNDGLMKAKKGDFDGAMADFNKAIEINPKDSDAYAYRGAIKAKKDDFDGAILDVNKAIEMNPKQAYAYSVRGAARGSKGDYEGAMADLTKAIEINPKDAQVYYNRGALYNAKGDLEGAISDFSKAIEINPKLTEAYYNRGIAFDQKSNGKDYFDSIQALRDYAKVVELDPNNPKYVEAYCRLGDVAAGQANYDSAIQLCDKAIELNPEYSKAYAIRAGCYYYKKEYGKSWADISKAESFGVESDSEFIGMLRKASGREK